MSLAAYASKTNHTFHKSSSEFCSLFFFSKSGVRASSEVQTQTNCYMYVILLPIISATNLAWPLRKHDGQTEVSVCAVISGFWSSAFVRVQFPLCQNFRKFRSKRKWNCSAQVEIFRSKESTSRGGPLWPVGLVRTKLPFHFQKFSFPVPLRLVTTHSIVKMADGSDVSDYEGSVCKLQTQDVNFLLMHSCTQGSGTAVYLNLFFLLVFISFRDKYITGFFECWRCFPAFFSYVTPAPTTIPNNQFGRSFGSYAFHFSLVSPSGLWPVGPA